MFARRLSRFFPVLKRGLSTASPPPVNKWGDLYIRAVPAFGLTGVVAGSFMIPKQTDDVVEHMLGGLLGGVLGVTFPFSTVLLIPVAAHYYHKSTLPPKTRMTYYKDD